MPDSGGWFIMSGWFILEQLYKRSPLSVIFSHTKCKICNLFKNFNVFAINLIYWLVYSNLSAYFCEKMPFWWNASPILPACLFYEIFCHAAEKLLALQGWFLLELIFNVIRYTIIHLYSMFLGWIINYWSRWPFRFRISSPQISSCSWNSRFSWRVSTSWCWNTSWIRSFTRSCRYVDKKW